MNNRNQNTAVCRFDECCILGVETREREKENGKSPLGKPLRHHRMSLSICQRYIFRLSKLNINTIMRIDYYLIHQSITGTGTIAEYTEKMTNFSFDCIRTILLRTSTMLDGRSDFSTIAVAIVAEQRSMHCVPNRSRKVVGILHVRLDAMMNRRTSNTQLISLQNRIESFR